MNPDKRVLKAVEEAQGILARHVEPGRRDCEQTINQLLDVLDDETVVQAIEELDNGKAHRGAARRTQEAQRDCARAR